MHMRVINRWSLLAVGALVAGLALFLGWGSSTIAQETGGPVVLMGIDAEDGGPGAHGPITVYEDVVSSILAEADNGGSGILVIGGGKSPTDNVTTFWDTVGADIGESITYVNGAGDIATQSFAGFAMLAVVGSVDTTSSGGLTQAENDAVGGRGSDVAAFVNGGGGLLGFTQTGFTNPYEYVGGIGSFDVRIGLGYNDITPTDEGLAIGITDALDVCCWHDTYLMFPDFLEVLATNNDSSSEGFDEPAAIGGADVVFFPEDPTPTEVPETPEPADTPVPATETPEPAATVAALPDTGASGPSDGGSTWWLIGLLAAAAGGLTLAYGAVRLRSR